MNITKIIAIAALLVLAPSGASAAALYGGGTAAVGAAGVSVGAGTSVSAGASSTSGGASGSATADMGIAPPDTSVELDTNGGAGAAVDGGIDAYGKALMASDANVANVDAAGEGEISVEYLHPGRLFGIFPVKVRSETKAMLDESGAVKVETQMPWWNFFVTGTGDTRAAVDESLSASSQISADLKMQADASARERVLTAIVKAHAAASAAAEASADQP